MNKCSLRHHAVSVRLSVRFVDSVKMNNRIVKKFFTIGWPHHSSFSIPNVMAIFRLEHPVMGASNAGGEVEIRILSQYLAPLLAVNCSSGLQRTIVS